MVCVCVCVCACPREDVPESEALCVKRGEGDVPIPLPPAPPPPGQERVIFMTTNFLERLDPALLRCVCVCWVGLCCVLCVVCCVRIPGPVLALATSLLCTPWRRRVNSRPPYR